MEHGPPTEWEKEKSEGFKTRLGIYMFIAYTALYLAFVFLCVLGPKLVAKSVGSLNIAITFGFALIIVAIIQALVYNYLCSRKERLEIGSGKAKGEVTK